MISSKQQRIFDYIRHYSEIEGEPPTLKEIGEEFNMSSPASVYQNVVTLEREGLITKVPNVARGIRVT